MVGRRPRAGRRLVMDEKMAVFCSPPAFVARLSSGKCRRLPSPWTDQAAVASQLHAPDTNAAAEGAQCPKEPADAGAATNKSPSPKAGHLKSK